MILEVLIGLAIFAFLLFFWVFRFMIVEIIFAIIVFIIGFLVAAALGFLAICYVITEIFSGLWRDK